MKEKISNSIGTSMWYYCHKPVLLIRNDLFIRDPDADPDPTHII